VWLQSNTGQISHLGLISSKATIIQVSKGEESFRGEKGNSPGQPVRDLKRKSGIHWKDKARDELLRRIQGIYHHILPTCSLQSPRSHHKLSPSWSQKVGESSWCSSWNQSFQAEGRVGKGRELTWRDKQRINGLEIVS
jgi:hypothetical protein